VANLTPQELGGGTNDGQTALNGISAAVTTDDIWNEKWWWKAVEM